MHPARRRLLLLTEAPFESVSGASIYHRRMITAWRAMGFDAEYKALQPAEPFDPAPWSGWQMIIDGILLRGLGAHIDLLSASGACVLVHHPAASEPGRSDAERGALYELERAALPRFRRVIAASAPIAERLAADFGVQPDAIRVVTPGTDDAPRSVIDGSRPPGSPCPILSLGTLTYRKGHDVLLRALARLADLDWSLILAGEARDPAYAAELPRLAAELGIAARVQFRGPLLGASLEAAWQGAELFALATRFEGCGMAIAEALRRGVPVAITAGGAAGTLVPPDTGVVAPVDDVDQLSKAMRRLIFSPALRASMGEHAAEAGRALPGWAGQATAFAIAIEA